jgi:transcription initiation factor TFIIIB Brf1 subunit/transcription initiation factor TFIIB
MDTNNNSNICDEENHNESERRLKWNSMTCREITLNHDREFISEICSKNNIKKIVIDDAKLLYKEFIDYDRENLTKKPRHLIIRGNYKLSIIAACIFIACKKNDEHLSTKEIAEIFNLEEKRILNTLDKFSLMDEGNIFTKNNSDGITRVGR